MEQIQFIIGVIVVIAILVVKTKKTTAKTSAKIPDSHKENFPFPTFDDQQSIDEWLGRSAPVKEEMAPVVVPQIKGDEMAVRSIKEKPKVVVEKSQEVDFEFDVEKAVIYSEIMTPKFNEY